MYSPLPLSRAWQRPALRRLSGVAALVLALAGCDTAAPDGPVSGGEGLEGIRVAPTFDYATTQEVTVEAVALSNTDQPLADVPFEIYDGDALVAAGRTDAQGRVRRTLRVPASRDALVVRTGYLGLPSEQTVRIEDGALAARFGGARELPESAAVAAAASSAFSYLGRYDRHGKPRDLIKPRDVVSPAFLADINDALAERAAVPESHPEYLADGVVLDARLQEPADVWVTFVHEGAGYQNSLGFFTYDPAAPPASPADIDEHVVAFPNASYDGDGGKLQTGDKVYLGSFPAGTALGWFIVADGWSDAAREVSAAAERYYSVPAFNTDGAQQSILMQFDDRDQILLSFDDQARTDGDEDFNDVVFYITADPVSAVDRDGIVVYGADPNPDADGDTVPDADDAEPLDPAVASYQYAPAAGVSGTLAYEDLWPGEGDYDFNDLVVGYGVRFGLNAGGDLTKLTADFVVRSIGAAYHNGLALSLPLAPADVASVNGQRFDTGLFAVAGNGTEQGVTSSAVVPVFDDAYGLLSKPGGYSYANTQPGAPHVAPTDTVRIAVTFARPLPPSETGALSMEWMNPFLVIDQQRGMEVHLPNQPPTDLADASLFGASQDATDVAAGVTYKTKTGGLPWALHFGEGFDYPVERGLVTDAYPQFRPWAESGGTEYTDWYNNPAYRNEENVYQP